MYHFPEIGAGGGGGGGSGDGEIAQVHLILGSVGGGGGCRRSSYYISFSLFY